MKNRALIPLGALALMAGCAEEQAARTVQEFLDNPIMLEAAVVSCAQNRSQSRYDTECVNARQAISIIEAKEERARRDAFEAQSDRKREALRQTQEAAARARRRATEAERLRKEAAYLAQFGELPPAPDGEAESKEAATNAPGVIIPTPEAETGSDVSSEIVQPASDGGNAPVAADESGSDLSAIRDELRQRNDETGD